MSKEKRIKYQKPAIIRGIVITALIVLTLLLPIVKNDGISYLDRMTAVNLFNDGGLKFLILLFVDGILGTSNEKVVEIIGYALYVLIFALIVIAIIDLIFFIISLCTKRYNKFFKAVNVFTNIITFLSFLANLAMFVIIILMGISSETSIKQILNVILSFGGHMFLVWSILSMWLFCIKCKVGKRQSF